jgi:hypothetical protein
MIESNVNPGRQDIPADLSALKPFVSVTDACIDWETTCVLASTLQLRRSLILPSHHFSMPTLQRRRPHAAQRGLARPRCSLDALVHPTWLDAPLRSP